MMAPLVLAAALLAGPAEDLAALRQEVDALKQAVSEAAGQRSLAELEARIERLQGELERLRRTRATDDDVRRALESLQNQVAELERRMAALRVRNEDVTSSWPAASHATFEDGFALRGNDDAFLLRLHAYFQLRFEGVDVEDRRETAQAPDRSTFTLPRSRLELTGNAFLPTLTYRLLFDFSHDPILLDAWAEWAPLPWLAVRGGRFKTPFSRQALVPENRFQMVDRADATDLFRADRDLGAQVSLGAWDRRIALTAALQNGGAGGPQNDNIDFLYAARLTIDPLGPMPRDEDDPVGLTAPLVSVGGSFLYDLVPTDAQLVGLPIDVDGDGHIDNVARWLAGAELAARWRGASFAAELFYRKLDFGSAASSVPHRSSFGGYLQAGYYVLPGRLELAARYSYAEPTAFGLAGPARDAVPDEHHEYTFGATDLLFGHAVKGQLEYSYLEDEHVRELSGSSRSSHRVRAQLQFGF
jgi:phosphate-selective porin OprO/OprP